MIHSKLISTHCVKLQLPAEKLHWFSKFDIWSFLTIRFLIDSLWWSLHIGKLKQIFVSPETEIETDMNNMAQYLMSISPLNFFIAIFFLISQIEIKFSECVHFLPNIQFRTDKLILQNWQNDQWSQCHSIQMPLMLLLMCILNEKVKEFFHMF